MATTSGNMAPNVFAEPAGSAPQRSWQQAGVEAADCKSLSSRPGVVEPLQNAAGETVRLRRIGDQELGHA
jgi:hypothetical protein